MSLDFSKFTPNIFKTKPVEEKVSDSAKDHQEENISFERYGFRQAGHMNGSTEGLKICLNRVFLERLGEMRRDEAKQEELRNPFRITLQEHITINQGLENQITLINTEIIPSKKQKKEELNKDIAEIRKNPEHYTDNHVGKAGYYIGCIILSLLTIYLFVFYSSASYSALFKDFTPDETVVAKAIFDSQAISKALKDGLSELILILTIPAVFIGLGYLIHKFQESKNKVKYLKIAALLFVTFIFDFIIAYEITAKIYELIRNSAFENPPPPYSLKIAFTNVSFWLVIFAGFIVYIIWGFVFDFVMEAYSKLDHVKVNIKIKREEMELLTKEISDYENKNSELRLAIEKNNTEINKLRDIINGTIVHPKEMKEALSQFMVGWYKWLANGREYSRSEHNKIYEDFVIANITTIDTVINPN